MNPSGTPAPIEGLYIQHQSWLRDWLRRKTGCPFDAADLTHDTYLKVLVREDDTRALREPRAYLTTIAHGLMVNLFRRRDIERAYLDSLALVRTRTRLRPNAAPWHWKRCWKSTGCLTGCPPRCARRFFCRSWKGCATARSRNAWRCR